jgi:hypothetical protein
MSERKYFISRQLHEPSRPSGSAGSIDDRNALGVIGFNASHAEHLPTGGHRESSSFANRNGEEWLRPA